MLKNQGQLIAGVIIGAILALLIAKQVFVKPGSNQNTNIPAAPQNNKPAENPVPSVSGNRGRDAGIPQKVYDDLQYIRQNNHAMPGYVGGRIFSNREEVLPREDNSGNPILYHEWDVNPKIQGQNRGTERIITGSDGRAWYTNDHYQTFKEIK